MSLATSSSIHTSILIASKDGLKIQRRRTCPTFPTFYYLLIWLEHFERLRWPSKYLYNTWIEEAINWLRINWLRWTTS